MYYINPFRFMYYINPFDLCIILTLSIFFRLSLLNLKTKFWHCIAHMIQNAFKGYIILKYFNYAVLFIFSFSLSESTRQKRITCVSVHLSFSFAANN